jgi:hypothetical protein
LDLEVAFGGAVHLEFAVRSVEFKTVLDIKSRQDQKVN